MHDLTDRVVNFAEQVGGDGLLHVFVPHATAGVALMETGSGSEADLDELLERVFPRDDRYAHRHGSVGHGGDHLVPVFVSSSLVLAVIGGVVQLGTWQSVVLIDPNRENDVRTVRSQLRRGLSPGSQEESRGLQVLARGTLLAGRRRHSLHVAFSQQHEVVAVELDLESRTTAGTSTRSPSLATRTSGPTNATSPQERRLGAGAAVAGISSPPALLRSPLSGVRTTSRSPVSRIDVPPAVFFERDFRLAGALVGGLLRRRGLGHVRGSVASATRYDASPWKPGECSREP